MFRKGRNHCYGQKSPEDIYKQVSVTKCPTKISESQVSHSKDTSYSTIRKTFILPSLEWIKSLLWKEVRTFRWNSLEKNYKERSNRSLKKFKKPRRKGFRVDMATAIYKAANVTLDEDLTSQIKRKKDVEMETEDLQEKLDMFQLKV